MIGGEVELADIAPKDLLTRCDIHLATRVGAETALDVFRKDMANWPIALNELFLPHTIPSDVIISLIEIPSQRDTWLFAGFVHVSSVRNKSCITVRHEHEFKGLIGRLKLKFRRGGASKPFLKGEKHLQNIIVQEILPTPFTSEPFPGYENINISFRELRALVDENQSDWVVALSNMKGVYLITDKSTGRKYVGAAYGEEGLWQRWKIYAKTGHGNNSELLRLHKSTLNYAQDNFSFSLLEHHPKIVRDEKIISREAHWKTVLLTRTHGYNRN
ncbi:GIY-YIG nuclease family protein [Pseudomonas sp. RC2C2]|uniref:GIY-YIG nuclease family protein n=1 Tax=Pseudomonas sp. RC2C2 TaxID=2834408 RepID=UPI001BCFFA2F|nr:GIY-YIG nuclease family protein [Pseudomonas sp. RC2C2]MBS7599485.1 GIY-YIG nuclease family protein [Pseudomonas sp. RC2C2]